MATWLHDVCMEMATQIKHESRFMIHGVAICEDCTRSANDLAEQAVQTDEAFVRREAGNNILVRFRFSDGLAEGNV